MGNAICTSYGLGPPKSTYKHLPQGCVVCPPAKIIYKPQTPRQIEYWPESPQWAGVARNLEVYLSEKSKMLKYRREKDMNRCTRKHVDDLPPGSNRQSSNDQFYTAPLWPRMQNEWAAHRPLPMQQDWTRGHSPGYRPYYQASPNPNLYRRPPGAYFEDDDLDEHYQAQSNHHARSSPLRNHRRGAFRRGGSNRHMQDREREAYDSDEFLQRPQRPARQRQGYDAGDPARRFHPSRGRHKPYVRPYDSDPEGMYDRERRRDRWGDDEFGETQANQGSRRREDEEEGAEEDG